VSELISTGSSKLYALTLVVFNLLILTFGLLGGSFFGEAPHSWFARSGSIITISSFICELVIMREVAQTQMEISLLNIDIKNAPFTKDKQYLLGVFNKAITRHSNNINIFVCLNVFVGTVIWGYGDVIYLWVMNN